MSEERSQPVAHRVVQDAAAVPGRPDMDPQSTRLARGLLNP